MQIRFLLGPAGVGKTWRCLEEIRTELAQNPSGPPLILLAPKQATFQLERQLLDGHALQAYTRLHILSFERLARFVFDRLQRPQPEVLAEEGRIMVLRALLQSEAGALSIFKHSATRPGFAAELSQQLREFQNHGLTPDAVLTLAINSANPPLRNKLRDLAHMFRAFLQWLKDHELHDADALLAIASDLLERLEANHKEMLRLGGLWFDGFAQLTPLERRFLASILSCSERATLAFCYDGEQFTESPLNHWSGIRYSFHCCRFELESRFGKDKISFETLERTPGTGRFRASPALARIESRWCAPEPLDSCDGVQVVECLDPEAEVTYCAREILKHVQAGGRFRDVALLLRGFGNEYPHILRHVFTRYEIPFFLDHRAGVSHHPVAQLTRGALRTVAFNWKLNDWLSALKSGVVHSDSIKSEDLDELENEALARGWEGKVWTEGIRIRDYPDLEKRFNKLRLQLVPPFQALGLSLGSHPTGNEVADALKVFWEELGVQASLERMASSTGETLHATVWKQMESWVGNIRLAFAQNRLHLRDWIHIIDSGLAGLTVGAIPPSLDQVLIGAVDRSRNPDLKTLFILGCNEGVFPASSATRGLLGEYDRKVLLDSGSELGMVPQLQLSQEQFYGYIACTRPRERLVITFAKTSAGGAVLNPSRFISHLKRLLPKLEVAPATLSLGDLAHVHELSRFKLASADLEALFQSPADSVQRWREQFAQICPPNPNEALSEDLAAQLYGNELHVSVSAMERYAMCPFRFYLEQGLKVREREVFDLDVREQGSLVHEVLQKLHIEIQAQNKQWRDLTAVEARALVKEISEIVIAEYRDGLATANPRSRFTAETYKLLLDRFVNVIWDWFRTNRFDPAEVEFGFGPKEEANSGPLRISIDNKRELVLNGRTDRLDILKLPDGRALCAILDYKTGTVKPNKTLLFNGVQQQLTAYLLAFIESKALKEKHGASELVPAGAFYVPIKSKGGSAHNRLRAAELPGESRKSGFVHSGIFNFSYLEHFDSQADVRNSGQFHYKKTDSGKPHGAFFGGLEAADFTELLNRTRENLRSFGRDIYSGVTAIAPYRMGNQIACGNCKFIGICRFDSWRQEYRFLQPPPKGEKAKAKKARAAA